MSDLKRSPPTHIATTVITTTANSASTKPLQILAAVKPVYLTCGEDDITADENDTSVCAAQGLLVVSFRIKS